MNFSGKFCFTLMFVIVYVTSSNAQIYYRDARGMGCPEFDQYNTVHLPHADCRKFLTCMSKSVMEQTCPGQLHWNIEKNMCDFPHLAGCEQPNEPQYNQNDRFSRESIQGSHSERVERRMKVDKQNAGVEYNGYTGVRMQGAGHQQKTGRQDGGIVYYSH